MSSSFCLWCKKEIPSTEIIRSEVLSKSKFFERFIGVCRKCRDEYLTRAADRECEIRRKEQERKNAIVKKYSSKNRSKESFLRNKWKLTIDDFESMMNKQDRKCAICGKREDEMKRGFHIDHNHATGKIRGLLCLNCNTGLGMFKDNPKLISKAKEYLEACEL